MCNEELFIITLTAFALILPFLVFPFGNRVDKKNYKKISHPDIKEHCIWCGAKCDVYKKLEGYSDEGKPYYRISKLCTNYSMFRTNHTKMAMVGLYESLEELLIKYES